VKKVFAVTIVIAAIAALCESRATKKNMRNKKNASTSGMGAIYRSIGCSANQSSVVQFEPVNIGSDMIDDSCNEMELCISCLKISPNQLILLYHQVVTQSHQLMILQRLESKVQRTKPTKSHSLSILL
jgi:hypothetical protein